MAKSQSSSKRPSAAHYLQQKRTGSIIQNNAWQSRQQVQRLLTSNDDQLTKESHIPEDAMIEDATVLESQWESKKSKKVGGPIHYAELAPLGNINAISFPVLSSHDKSQDNLDELQS